MSLRTYDACCFGTARAWYTSSQILFSKNSSDHSEDVAFYRNCQGKYTAHKKRRHSRDRDEKCNQEILEGRQLQRTSGWLIIKLIREQCNPNNTQTNCFKENEFIIRSAHERMQMKYDRYYYILLFFPKRFWAACHQISICNKQLIQCYMIERKLNDFGVAKTIFVISARQKHTGVLEFS